MGNPVNFFQISAAEGGPLQAFYKKIFAWKTNMGPGGMMMVGPEKGGIAGAVGASQNGASSVAVYVDVADIGAQLTKVEQAGGQIALQPMELPGGMGTIAGFMDPAGNWIGLWQAPKKAVKRAPAKRPAKSAPKKKAKKSSLRKRR